MSCLPVVKDGVGDSVMTRLRFLAGPEWHEASLRELHEKNPELASLLKTWARGAANQKGPVDPVAFAETAGLFVYQVLKSQAEADELERELRGKL